MSAGHVVVIGAGVSGLAAAHRLRERVPGREVTVLEAGARAGGCVVGERVGDFLLDGGPDSFVAAKPQAAELCRALGLGDALVAPATSRLSLLRGGRLVPYPEGFSLGLPTRLAPLARTGLLSWPGKLRAVGDLWAARAADDDDESVAAFLRRRIGREAAERIAIPILAGVYAGDPERLSLRAAFPQIAEMERAHGSLIRAIRARPPSGPTFLTLRGGLGRLIDRLVEAIGPERVRLGAPARRIERRPRGWEVHGPDGPIAADHVVLTVKPHQAQALLGEDVPALARALERIPTVSTATVFLAYPAGGAALPPEGLGYVVPAGEDSSLLAATWVSNKFPDRAPAGTLLLRAFVGGARFEGTWAWPEDALFRLVEDEVGALLGFQQPPLLRRVFRFDRASPQYQVGHAARVAAAERALADAPGLHVAGNALRGVGLSDAIREGQAAADRIGEAT